MSPLDTPVAIALIVVAVAFTLARGYATYRRTGAKLDAALPHLINPDHKPCAHLTCTEPADDWIYDRAMCAGHAEAIRGRSDR